MSSLKINISHALLFTILVSFLFITENQAITFNKAKNLESKVTAALSAHYQNNFYVTANNRGVVQIEGNVNTLYDKYRIYDIIAKVPGVKRIRDLLAVNSGMVPDNMIKANVIEDLSLEHSILEPNRIKVNVDNGVIELNGNVSFAREKLLAETVASWQKGATGIVNNINVLKPKIADSDKNLRKELADILKDRFPIENKLHFRINDGKVHLAGYAETSWAKHHIVKDFLRVKGVKGVKNSIIVEPNKYPYSA